MKNDIKRGERGEQILRLLQLHGPLSHRSLLIMLSPPIKPRRLSDALFRLIENGLIAKRFEKVFRGSGVFYQLVQGISGRAKLSELLGQPADDFLQPHFRYRELIHSEDCALWSHQLKKLFGEAEIVPDFRFSRHSLAQRIMLAAKEEYELRPDLLLIFPKSSTSGSTAIAVEIEKSRKSEKRLVAKLRKYANRTLVDGVIYACDSDSIGDAIRSVCKSHVIDQSMRIKHYGEYFFMFTDSREHTATADVQMFGPTLASISLSGWVNLLRNTSRNLRRESLFKNVSSPLLAKICVEDASNKKNSVIELRS